LILLTCLGKLLSIIGVGLLVFSISPSKDFVNPDDSWFEQQRKWIERFRKRKDGYSTTVSVNPLLLYSGLILSVLGILLS
jgi:hypothetical protein